jgi:hypothetical protein
LSTKINDSEMTSDATPHTATAWPVPGEPTLWSVTWLPGRALTRDQAVTAMTIAEMVGAHADAVAGAEGRWRLHLASWAAELGLSADEAIEMASASAEHDAPAQPRANRSGDPCPEWCVTDHDAVLLEAADGRPALYAHGHHSDPVTDNGPFAPRVYVGEYGTEVRVFASTLSKTLHALPGRQAEELAGFIEQLAECPPDQLRQMAADVRAAAATARAAE